MRLVRFYPEQALSRALILLGLGTVIPVGMVLFDLQREAILRGYGSCASIWRRGSRSNGRGSFPTNLLGCNTVWFLLKQLRETCITKAKPAARKGQKVTGLEHRQPDCRG
jgi:hypothetical protein